MHLDAGMAALVPAQKRRERALDRHRRRSYAQDAGLPAFKGPRPGVERIGFHEQAAALPEQILALRSQPETPADAVEEPQAELGLERENLPRRRGLAHAQPRPRAGDAAGL